MVEIGGAVEEPDVFHGLDGRDNLVDDFRAPWTAGRVVSALGLVVSALSERLLSLRRAALPGVRRARCLWRGPAMTGRARLEAFELRHTAWDNKLKCVVWRTRDGAVPLARLHPQPLVPTAGHGPSRALEELRRQIAERIDEINRGD